MAKADNKNKVVALAGIKPISRQIAERLISKGLPFLSTDNISSVLREKDLDLLQEEVQIGMERVLRSLVIDIDNDHNTKDTAKRLAKMFIKEVFVGRYSKKPNITEFPNVKNLDELYVVGPIDVKSSCSHHFAPIIGKVWIGIHPNDKVMGLSKFHRICEWINRRPQIQEEATVSIADEIEKTITPKGIGVIFKAKHMCCSWRGVNDNNTLMTTSVVRGTLRDIPAMKTEFLMLVENSQ